MKKLQNLGFFTIFNFRDDLAKGRCAMLISSITGTIVTYLAMSGTLYIAFLTANDFSIIDTGIIGFIPAIAAIFRLFSPVLLERLKKRRAVLVTARLLYFSINIIGIDLVTRFVDGQSAKLFWFGVVIFISSAFNALTSSGWTAWHLNFIPESVRAKYFSYQMIVSNLSAGITMLITGLIADSIRGSVQEVVILSLLRIVGILFAVIDVIVLALPKEYPYPTTGERIRMINTFRYPLRHRKYMLTILIIVLWTFSINLPATWSYYLLNTIHIKVTLSNMIDFIYSAFLLALSPFARKMVAKFSWFKTYAIWVLVNACSLFVYALGIRSIATPALFFVAIRLTQHVIGVPLYLSYSNFAYINMPKENQTYFLSFYLLISEAATLLGQMCGTLILKLVGDRVFTVFGLMVEGPAILVLLQATFQVTISVMIFAMGKFLLPEEEPALS